MMKTKITAEVMMSVEQYQKSVNTLDKEIATLEKKKVEADKKCADIQSKINSIQKNIASRTSANMVASKKKQIASLQAEYSKKMSSRACLKNILSCSF